MLDLHSACQSAVKAIGARNERTDIGAEDAELDNTARRNAGRIAVRRLALAAGGDLA